MGSEFVVDVYVEVDEKVQFGDDQLENTVNYESLFVCCREVMKGRRRKLIETLAADICKMIRSHHSKIIKVRTRVSKLNPPVPGRVDRSYFELED